MHQVRMKIGQEELVLETGKMAKQANGSIYASYGGSVVLATVCCASKPTEGLDFVPLSVEYNEKYYAAGKIPGGFLKREGRPKDKEILVSRLIDRPIRPLFDKKFAREIQIVPTTISTDQINPPDVIGMVAAFAAVSISDIPFAGPVGAVRIASVDGELIVNPTFDQIEKSELEIVVAGTEAGITMVEGGGKEVPEELLLKAIEKAEGFIKDLCRIQNELVALAGKPKLPMPNFQEKVLSNHQAVWDFALPKMQKACFVKGKFARVEAIHAVRDEVLKHFAAVIPESEIELVPVLIDDMERHILRESILAEDLRCDARNTRQIRPITCEIDLLPRTHGSALFTRGETQALAISTLGTVFDEQIMDDIDGDKRSTFMLHYNFPPFSVGETGRLSTGRREIGHGHLAQRALQNVLPKYEDFPYTVRVVSEVLESNGSSSMATVCGGSLALLAAGVPMKRPVAGIAMGLVTDGSRWKVLSDILGEEDHLGDMDFKVAGTEKGITGFQMDIKVSNVTREILTQALAQAREGRLHILGIMNQVIAKPMDNISAYAPKILKIKIDPDKIGMIIGPGGKNVKAISEETGATINIDNDGTITLYSKNREGAEMAQAKIKGMVEDPEVGSVYNGTVKRIMDFGAFIEILPGKEGLCHISKLTKERVNTVSEVLKENQHVKVRLIEVDKMGRLNLSIVDVPEEEWAKHGERPVQRK
ncbi:MAG: polyribonucleotide nucleotidyltransferase [Spirochaetales bacterium]|nr:polyribonucleotide nucleotidyltransferase [Spirochaetales bacterium]